MDDLDRADDRLRRDLDRGFYDAARRAGAWLACGPGCSECCVGPFPITRLDAHRLRRGLSELRRAQPERAHRIDERVRVSVQTLTDGYPGNAVTGTLSEEVEILDRFFERHGTLPCPVLDPESGRCELYDSRPVGCRTYGPPLRFAEEDAPPCPLCFEGAPTEVVDRCRFEPDAHGEEDRILSEMGVAAGDEWETLIPFALRDEAVGVD